MILNSYELWTFATFIILFIFCCIISVLDSSEIRQLKNRKVADFFRKALIAQIFLFIFAFSDKVFLEDERGAWTITGKIVLFDNTKNINPKNSSISLTPPLMTIHEDGVFESKVIFERESGEWVFPTLKITMPHTYATKTIHLNPKKFEHIEGMSNEYQIIVNAISRTILIKNPIELDPISEYYNPNSTNELPERLH